MILPQRPYMVLGTLRQQLLYPVFDGGPNDTIQPHLQPPHTIESKEATNGVASNSEGEVRELGNGSAPEGGVVGGSIPGWVPQALFPRETGTSGVVEMQNGNGSSQSAGLPTPPSDSRLIEVLSEVRNVFV